VIRLGYPAQNLTIPASTNRTLQLANLGDAEKVRALVWENLLGLETILRWNAEHGINLFRMGQSLIPFASHPAFPYDWEAEHGDDLRGIGELARSLGIRLSMHSRPVYPTRQPQTRGVGAQPRRTTLRGPCI
jgi:UV DNA damage endonuclease